MAKSIITEADVLSAVARGEKKLVVCAGDLVTPQARDTALAMGVDIDEGLSGSLPCAVEAASASVAPQESSSSGKSLPVGISELATQIVESLRGKIPAGVDNTQVECLVREVVAARMAGPEKSGAKKSGSTARDMGIVFVDCSRLLSANAPTAAIRDKAILADAFGHLGECKLAAGYLAWEKSSMERVVEAPEVCIVIEGELHLTAGGETLVGKPGDMLYLPPGVKVTYSTPSRVKLACVGHQA